MLFYWPKLLYPDQSLLLFFPYSSFCLQVGIVGWGLRTDRVYITLSQPYTADLFFNNNEKLSQTYHHLHSSVPALSQTLLRSALAPHYPISTSSTQVIIIHDEQVMRIIENVQPGRQTVMFSATFPRQVEALAKKILQKPVEIMVRRTLLQILYATCSAGFPRGQLMDNMQEVSQIFHPLRCGVATSWKSWPVLRFGPYDVSFFDYSSTFCFLLIEFHCTFFIFIKYYHIIFINIAPQAVVDGLQVQICQVIHPLLRNVGTPRTVGPSYSQFVVTSLFRARFSSFHSHVSLPTFFFCFFILFLFLLFPSAK